MLIIFLEIMLSRLYHHVCISFQDSKELLQSICYEEGALGLIEWSTTGLF